MYIWITVTLFLVCVKSADISKRGAINNLDDLDPDLVVEPCPDGKCKECPPGLYLEGDECKVCPYNTYSEDGVKCLDCPGNKKTVYQATGSADKCDDICVIPTHTRTTFLRDKDKAHLDYNDRVRSGTRIIVTCHKGYTLSVEGGESETVSMVTYMFVTCTPDLFFPPDCDIHKIDSYAICYDNCYKEVNGGEAQLKALVNGQVTELDQCPLVSCPKSQDVCVTVSTTNGKSSLHKFRCADSAVSDEALCLETGEGECKVKRCTEDKCNDPALSSARTPFSCVALVTMVITTFFFRST